MPADLVTAAEVTDALPASSPWASASAGEQAALASSASRAIERFCDRTLGQASFDETHRPGRSRRIQLRAYPVASIARVAADLATLLSLRNADAATLRASAATTVSGAPDALAATGIALTPGGTFPFATYPTLAALAAALGAVSGWTATVAAGYGAWASADLNPELGPQGAKDGPAEFHAFARDLRVAMDYDQARRGELELLESLPDGYQFPDRTRTRWGGSDPRWGGVRVQYTAGYATADVPADLKRAAIAVASALAERMQAPGLVKSETVGAYSYTLADLPQGVVALVADLVAPYRRLALA